MNSNRSSRAVVAVLGLVLLVAAVAPAAAAVPSIDGSAPDTAEVGSTVDRTYTLTDLFTEYNEWTLTAETDLSEVTWTVTTYDNTGQQIAQETYTGQSFQHALVASDGAVRATVRLQATVPEVSESLWSYDPPQQYTVAEFAQTQQGGSSTTISEYLTRPYTQQSSQARTQIDQAKAAIQDAENSDVSVSDAKATLQNAVSAYNNANFQLAVDLANEAEQQAEDALSAAQQSQQTTRLLLYGGVALVVVLLAAGGYLLYRRNQGSQDKLA
ncbi:DUF4398 domain-containing protein [Salarchaeum sp. JOR-1]|uniref:DUF4398 domain-containing protein n=1 Tax=Salarchaeum sp. JOR-1 TaxID=2599399 RepID=UPI0011987DB4|nr:DUF4398 domain-containing protein [Salarchaeum sp. JOR-1]QDX40555.1 DUF4398 domain-containing protein [Salarchaeum sp. JOR-1]